jgi:hypothetical protein
MRETQGGRLGFLWKRKTSEAGAPRFRFRWRYAVSGFLVFGVLSLTIGTEDPVTVAERDIKARFETTFRINRDPYKTATGEKTYPLDSPTLNTLIEDLRKYGEYVSKQSFLRAHLKAD